MESSSPGCSCFSYLKVFEDEIRVADTTSGRSRSVDFTNSEYEENFDLIVVGSGLSGMTAAYTALSEDPTLKVTVLEAQPYIGGQLHFTTMGVNQHVSQICDLGAQMFHGNQTHLHQLLKELGLEVQSHYSSGNRIIQSTTEPFWRLQKNCLVKGWIARIDLKYFIYKVGYMSRSLDQYLYLDGVTMHEFLNGELFTSAAINVIKTFIVSVFGIEPIQMSAYYFLTILSGTTGLEDVLYSQQMEIKNGTQILLWELAKQIQFCVMCNQVVESIEQVEEKVHITTKSKVTYSARYVIVAVPAAQVLKIRFQPEAPKREAILSHHSHGHLTKFVFSYSNAFWRDKGDSGMVYGTGKPALKCDAGPFDVLYDATNTFGLPALAGICGGWNSIQWSAQTMEEARDQRLQQLAKYFGPDALDFLDYCEKVWTPVGGGLSPGTMGLYKELIAPLGRISWAGTEVASQWPGFLSGAVQSGRRAAVEALTTLNPGYVVNRDAMITEDGCIESFPASWSSAVDNIKTGIMLAAAIGTGWFIYNSLKG